MENVDNTSDTINTSARRTQPENERESRNRNLDILKAYIQRQRALLERIKQDVDHLQASKPALDTDPSDALSRILHSDNNDNLERRGEFEGAGNGGVGRLSELVSDVFGVGEATITKDIDWELFREHDVTPLHSLQPWSRSSVLSSVTHLHMPPPPTPSTPSLISPKSSLCSFVSLDSVCDQSLRRKESACQARVREMRAKTVDPALTIATQFLATLPPDSDDEGVKKARAKESREAKEARAREAMEARRARAQNGKPDTNLTSNGQIKKSGNRKKSEAAIAAAAIRPRGQGGRFKKKEQVVNETSAPRVRTASASGSASTSAAFAPGPSLSTRQRRFASSTPSAVSLDEDLHSLEGGRRQRPRRPSTRFGSVAPSVASVISTRSGSSVPVGGDGKAPMGWQIPSPAAVVPGGPPRGRLTIRIPARPPTKSTVRNRSGHRDRQTSASTSMSVSASLETSESTNTSLTASAEDGGGSLGGKHYGGGADGGGAAAAEDELHSSSPATTMRSASQTRFLSVKQEEEEHENGMDIDSTAGLEAVEQRNTRFRQDSEHESFRTAHQVKYEPSSQDGVVNSDEDDLHSDGGDSFVCELLPPIPGSSASSSSASKDVANGTVNGSANGKADTSRGSSRRGDKSSKTFNVTWSDEEQRVLDALLEQYPDGTRNRWAHISRAMGGARTPRQVASRVQKYFAKMKKWGVDMG